MLGCWITLCVIIGNYLTSWICHFFQLYNENNIAYLIGTLTKTVIATHVLLSMVSMWHSHFLKGSKYIKLWHKNVCYFSVNTQFGDASKWFPMIFTNYQLSLNVPHRLYKKPGVRGSALRCVGWAPRGFAVLDQRQENSQRDMMSIRN